jgi:hypothetical protein
MPTFTVFNIGTGHNQTELFNLLVQLHGLTAANGIDHQKRINDGPAGDKRLDEVVIPAFHMDNIKRDMTDAIIAWATRLGHQFDTSSVNLVGHSRGAIICVLIAGALFRLLRTLRCNLFLVDPVNMSEIVDADARTLYENVQECRRITMEDDLSPKTYPLQDVHYVTGVDRRVLHYRLPGTHGTATQCNAKVAADQPITCDPSPDKLWPIGATAQLEILRALHAWGTPLTGPANRLAADNGLLLRAYLRIKRSNVSLVRNAQALGVGGGYFVHINDMKNAAWFFQEKKLVQTMASFFGQRTQAELKKLAGENPHRGTPLFVNSQHAALFNAQWPNLYAYALDRLQAWHESRDLEVVSTSNLPENVRTELADVDRHRSSGDYVRKVLKIKDTP